MAEIIANQKAAADSADFTLADNTNATLFLKHLTSAVPPAPISASIQIKAADGSYTEIAVLNDKVPCHQVSGPGTYRVRKKQSDEAIGVEKL